MPGAPSELGDAETHGRGDRNCVLLLLLYKRESVRAQQSQGSEWTPTSFRPQDHLLGWGPQEVLGQRKQVHPEASEDRNHSYLKQ